MTNEEAIKVLKILSEITCDECKESMMCDYICYDIRAYAVAIKALEEKERYSWHDLEKNPEDLPKKNGKYIVFTESGFFGRWYWREGMDWTGVVMWQQLPEEIERRMT